MLPTLGELFGNPSSLHWAGQKADEVLTLGREQVADAIVAQPEEILFTAGATDLDNRVLIGAMSATSPHKNHLGS